MDSKLDIHMYAQFFYEPENVNLKCNCKVDALADVADPSSPLSKKIHEHSLVKIADFAV